jgi:hypothetical protein
MKDPVSTGDRAQQLIESDEWQAAWAAYRQRIFEEIEACPSDADAKILHLKRLLSAATGAKTHLERLITDGKLAKLDLEESRKRSKLFRVPWSA